MLSGSVWRRPPQRAIKRARPCAGDKDASVSVMVEKPKRVCHFGSSASASGGCRCTSPDPPQSRSSFQIGGNTNVHGRTGKKGKYVHLCVWGGGDALWLPAGIGPIFLQDYFIPNNTKEMHRFPQKNKKYNFFLLPRSILESSPTVLITIFS